MQIFYQFIIKTITITFQTHVAFESNRNVVINVSEYGPLFIDMQNIITLCQHTEVIWCCNKRVKERMEKDEQKWVLELWVPGSSAILSSLPLSHHQLGGPLPAHCWFCWSHAKALRTGKRRGAARMTLQDVTA